MTKIEQMLQNNIPVTVESSCEEMGSYAFGAMTPEQNEILKVILCGWDVIRDKRNQLLSKTDWTQLSDNGLTDEKKAEFIAYRKTLRDLPSLFESPMDVVFPEEVII